MNKPWLSVALLSVCFACTPVQEEPGETNTGGSAPTNTGGNRSSGGSPGSSGGSSGGQGGSVGTGGSVGAGGGAGGSTSGTGGGAGGSTSGSGGSTGSGGASGTGGSTGSPDASPAETGGGTPGAGGPAAALHDLVIKVPCPNAAATGGSCSVGTEVRAFDKPYMITGDPATTYKVKLKICAVYEARPYSGCMMHPESPKICINGMPGTGGFAPTYPTLALKAGDKTYYLNMESGYADKIFKFDYTATFEMKGGSMVNIISNGGSNGGIYTAYQAGARHTCPNVPGIMMQPFAGQFIHFQVVSTDPMN